jgi:hypothetical protein
MGEIMRACKNLVEIHKGKRVLASEVNIERNVRAL